MNLYESFKKYAVPAESVEDFCNKYHRRGAYHERGKEYMEYDLKDHIAEFERDGFTIIPSGSSTTGDVVAYYGQKLNVEIPVCKMCGGTLGQLIPGYGIICSSEYIGGDYCHSCQVEHCLSTNCFACTIGKYPDCEHIELKKHYMNNDD